MNHNEPAFPLDELCQVSGGVAAQHFGVTVRDYFAIRALPVAKDMLTHDRSIDMDPWHWNMRERQQCAEIAYRLADAMLKAREVQP